MTLRMDTVAAELPALIARHEETRAAAGAAIENARGALREWSDDPVAASARIEQALGGKAVPYALAEDDPAATCPTPSLGPVTVIGVDGSSITPDRFSTVRCYAINIGHALLPYGVAVEPSLDAVAEVGLDGDLLEGSGDMRQAPRGLATRLLRDVRELERGVELAVPAAAAGPAVLLLDGTLLPWDLHTRQASDEALAPYRHRTIDALDRIRDCGEPLSMGAYISASAAREVVAALEVLAPPPPDARGV
ncbi:MAG: DNA double-strand break repair nuclease NurA [Chloroflexota bacterium]|nr:DNA double-strand break repair nuclease NurA [Chloroflexota bacterium]